MKKIILFLALLCFFFVGFAQTTYFNSSPIISGKESTRLYSLEINDSYTIVTIEIEAIKHNNRINYWCTPNTFIMTGETKLCQVVGYIVNDKVEQCGYNHQWGWSDVSKGAKRYYKLLFDGAIPPGITTVSIVDKGTQEWNGYNYNVVHGYCFRNYTINNPRKNYTSITSEYSAKQNIDSNNDGICGIYEPVGSVGANLACIKINGEYKLIYLSSPSTYTYRSFWQIGDIKANLRQTASGIMKADWYNALKSLSGETYVAFDGVSMEVVINNKQSSYLKTYPVQSPSIGGGVSGSHGSEWTGTGFALNNGYIITNNHVVDGATSIVVLGVNGGSTEYRAQVISVDKKNDLALIRINDNRFHGFNNVPYAISNRICDVGEDVFVLGYPLTTFMGDEVKLTNGIISSRSGYQGDVSTYQISAPVQPGNSGGPLFDNQGNIVGIVNAGIPGAENVGYAIKTSYLYNLVGSAIPTSNIPQTNHVYGTSLADKVRAVKNCVFYIKCVGR